MVHRLAQRDVPFHDVVRAYHLAEFRWTQICAEHLLELTDDASSLLKEIETLGALVHEYVDKICAQLADEYEHERERWRRHHESVRTDQILGLIDGSVQNTTEAEQSLRYRLQSTHLAVVAWLRDQKNDGDVSARLHQAIAVLRRTFDCRNSPLVLERDRTTLWAWLPIPGDTAMDAAALEKELASEAPGVTVALGEPHHGAAGFAESHRAAISAQEVGLAAGSDCRPLVPYADVRGLEFLCLDIPRARSWVAKTLGPMAVDEPREHELRRTLEAFSASNQSATTAARLLNCHKNTVQYRIRTVEQMLGYPLDRRRIDLDLALLACRWLGPGMLTPAK